MIEKITITNHLGETYDLPLRTPDESGFVVASVTGLNPPKANVNFTDSSTLDGGYYNSARVGRRNIVFSLKFLPHLSIETCRHNSFRIFPIKKKIKMVFTTDERVVYTEGYVESNESSVFSKTTGTQISVLCPNSFFSELNTVDAMFGNVQAVFEFPFSNESTSDPLLEFSQYSDSHEIHIENHGEIEVGAIFNIDIGGAVGDILIGDSEGHLMQIDVSRIADQTGTALGVGDTIIINTIPGEKNITLRRNGVDSPAFYCIDRYFQWLELYPGPNVLYYSAVSGADNLRLTISYPVYYQGL